MMLVIVSCAEIREAYLGRIRNERQAFSAGPVNWYFTDMLLDLLLFPKNRRLKIIVHFAIYASIMAWLLCSWPNLEALLCACEFLVLSEVSALLIVGVESSLLKSARQMVHGGES